MARFSIKLGPGGIILDTDTGQVSGSAIRTFLRMSPGIASLDDEGIKDRLSKLSVSWEIVSGDSPKKQPVQETVQEPVQESEPVKEEEVAEESSPEPDEKPKSKKKSRWSSLKSKDEGEAMVGD